jgi:hypothetical protein
MLIYPLRTEIRLSLSGVQYGLRALSNLNVRREANVSIVFSEFTNPSAVPVRCTGRARVAPAFRRAPSIRADARLKAGAT